MKGQPQTQTDGDALCSGRMFPSCNEENVKKQTKGRVHYGFDRCPSIGTVSFDPKPLDRGERCPFIAASVYTEEGRPPHRPVSNTGSSAGRGGGRADYSEGGGCQHREVAYSQAWQEEDCSLPGSGPNQFT